MGFLDELNDLNRERTSLFDSKSKAGRDASDTYANLNQLYIEFYHLPSDRSVTFKAYITEWSDKFSSNYNTENVYGRNDPIHTFEGTSREISLAWECASSTAHEAQENLARVSLLAQFLYPAFKMQEFTFGPGAETLKVGTMAKAPLVKVRFANLILDSKGAAVDAATGMSDVNAKTGGLLCALDGLNISTDLEEGVIDATGISTPKTLTLSTTLKVIHQHTLGWDNSNKTWLGEGNAVAFPYNAWGAGAAELSGIEDRYGVEEPEDPAAAPSDELPTMDASSLERVS